MLHDSLQVATSIAETFAREGRAMFIIGCLLVALALLIFMIITWLALDPEREHSGFDVE